MKATKSVMKVEKTRNTKELNLALIPSGEKLYFFSYFDSIQPMKYTHSCTTYIVIYDYNMNRVIILDQNWLKFVSFFSYVIMSCHKCHPYP